MDTKRKILLIDDEELVLKLLRRVFENRHEVFTASDGASGVELVKKEKPFFVFLDINMPGMSGIATLERIKETGIPLTVWMLTAETDFDVALKAMSKGAAGYITKPFRIETILDVVFNAVENMEDNESGRAAKDKMWRRPRTSSG